MNDILSQEKGLTLPRFTADDAFDIGVRLRNRLRSLSEQPAVVNIALANGNNLLFHAASRSGVLPDNDLWVARKRKTVLRWGVSSWYMHNKMAGDESAFAAKYMLGDRAGEYASELLLPPPASAALQPLTQPVHGGGVPVRVQGVEGIVAVIVVSGLKQHEDHQIVVEALEAFQQAAA